MSKPITNRRAKFFDGQAWPHCGCLFFMTENAVYSLENDDLVGQAVELIRENGVTDPTSPEACVTIEVDADEIESVDISDGGFNYLAHQARSVEYSVLRMRLRKGERKRIACENACVELANCEQIGREF